MFWFLSQSHLIHKYIIIYGYPLSLIQTMQWILLLFLCHTNVKCKPSITLESDSLNSKRFTHTHTSQHNEEKKALCCLLWISRIFRKSCPPISDLGNALFSSGYEQLISTLATRFLFLPFCMYDCKVCVFLKNFQLGLFSFGWDCLGVSS